MLQLFPYVFVIMNMIVILYAAIPVFSIAGKLRFRHRAKMLRFTAVTHLVIYLIMDAFYLLNDSASEAIFLFLYFGGSLPVVVFMVRYFARFGPEAFEIEIERLFKSYGLTNREIDICQLLGEGKTNDQIADILYISLQTVKTHIHNIFSKTGVKNRVQLSNLLRHAGNQNTPIDQGAELNAKD
jgi:DNA-binding CsgD family transcriptional regulator